METNFDAIKLAVEAATGGKNTVLFDDLGNPSIMVRIPKFKISDVIAGGSNSVHPAFIVNGVEVDEIFISKYQNIVKNNRAYSLPMQDPAAYIDFDTARKACESKGKGWHLMTNAEWAAIALWCKKNNYFPRGNNNYGSDVSYPHEKGVETYKYDGKTGRVGTGSGPVTWAHDGSNSGIFDLNGNVWEWVGGLRLVDGEIQVIADNNAASDADMTVNSSHWKAIDKSGNLVAPKSANTLKFDYTVDPGTVNAGKGLPKLVTTLAHQQTNDEPYAAGQFEDMTADVSITPPEILKALAIYPDGTKANHGDYIYMRNKGERLPFRGGSFHASASAGVFALHLNSPRSYSCHSYWFSLRFRKFVILVSVFCFCHVSGNQSNQRSLISWWVFFSMFFEMIMIKFTKVIWNGKRIRHI